MPHVSQAHLDELFEEARLRSNGGRTGTTIAALARLGQALRDEGVPPRRLGEEVWKAFARRHGISPQELESFYHGLNERLMD